MITSKQWYDEQQDGLGFEFIAEIKKTIKRIEQNPLQFPKEKTYIHKALVDRFPYSIFFYINDITINIFAIFNHSRNPKIIGQRYKIS